MSSQTITEKKLLRKFLTAKDAAKRAVNNRLSIMFRHGYPLPQHRLKK